jgi:predicted nucleotidyltransferase
MNQKVPSLILGLEEIYSSQILSLFKSLPKGSEVILFGSRAKGSYREGSDIDLCFKQSGLSTEDLFFYSEKYHFLDLPWKLDIVLYESIQEPALKNHIDRVGKLLLKL